MDFLQNHLISTLFLAVGSPCTLLLLPTIQLPHSSTSASASSKTSQHHSLYRALCMEFARELLETHQAAAKLRVLLVQMLLATPACCEVVMTASSTASFLPVRLFGLWISSAAVLLLYKWPCSLHSGSVEDYGLHDQRLHFSKRFIFLL